MVVKTTETYWDIDGVSLNTYAYNITTLGDGRSRVPDVRGRNITVPYRAGTVWVKKYADESPLTLAMWVLGVQADGTQPLNGNFEAQFEDNLAMLKRLMWRPGELVSLRKRFWRNGEIVAATAKVEYTRGLAPDMQTPGYGRMTVNFNMPDPYFYGAEQTIVLGSGTNTIEVPGDYDTTEITLVLGANTTIRNTTYSPNLRLTTDIASTINVKNKTMGGISANAALTFSGSTDWFALRPGTNTITVDGTATIKFKPAFF